MSVSICMLGLGAIIISSWYSFMWQLAVRSERKRRLEQQFEEARPFDSELDHPDAA